MFFFLSIDLCIEDRWEVTVVRLHKYSILRNFYKYTQPSLDLLIQIYSCMYSFTHLFYCMQLLFYLTGTLHSLAAVPDLIYMCRRQRHLCSGQINIRFYEKNSYKREHNHKTTTARYPNIRTTRVQEIMRDGYHEFSHLAILATFNVKSVHSSYIKTCDVFFSMIKHLLPVTISLFSHHFSVKLILCFL